jgi:hypothetical protein
VKKFLKNIHNHTPKQQEKKTLIFIFNLAILRFVKYVLYLKTIINNLRYLTFLINNLFIILVSSCKRKQKCIYFKNIYINKFVSDKILK